MRRRRGGDPRLPRKERACRFLAKAQRDGNRGYRKRLIQGSLGIVPIRAAWPASARTTIYVQKGRSFINYSISANALLPACLPDA
jgi:hypothetical protein